MSKSTIDVDALHAKYLAERDKRIHNGKRGYIDPIGEFPDFDQDPWVEREIVRDPIVADIDVAILGGGFAGQLAAVHLQKAGIDDFRIVETASDFGGVWYWNRYPGIRCDIESYVYLPLLDEVGTAPKEKYSDGREIYEHARTIGRHFGLYDKALFQTTITKTQWDSEKSRWLVHTNRGDILRARFVVACSGYLHRPKYPVIPGIKDFKGRLFHPSRWDFSFTGGTSNGEMVGLKGKKVALVGTGATGIQILPHLAKYAERAYLVQRTPSAVGARNNRATDLKWFRSQKPGWHQERMDNFHAIITGVTQKQDLVDDCWTHSAAQLFKVAAGGVGNADPAKVAEEQQRYDYELMQGLRDRIDEIVGDKDTADKLKAWYNLFCKRPLYSDAFVECFNQPSVTLIDTDGGGVDKIRTT